MVFLSINLSECYSVKIIILSFCNGFICLKKLVFYLYFTMINIF